MYKIAVMGDYDSIYGFAALGLTTFPYNGDPEAAARTLKTLADSEYGIIYITEALAVTLEKQIAQYEDKLMPSIIPIPGSKGNTGEGIASVKRSVEKAVGSDILFGE